MTVIGPRAAIPSTGETRSEIRGEETSTASSGSASLPEVLPPVSIQRRMVVLYDKLLMLRVTLVGRPILDVCDRSFDVRRVFGKLPRPPYPFRSDSSLSSRTMPPCRAPWHLPRPDGKPASPRSQCSGGGVSTLTPHRASSPAKRRIPRAFGGFPASTAWSIRTASFRRLRWSLTLLHSSTRQVNAFTPSFGRQPVCGSQIPVRHGPSQTEGAPATHTLAVPLQ